MFRHTKRQTIPLHAAESGDPSEPVVVSGIVKRFGDLTALDRMSFRLRKGEIYGLVGPDGAGKTTTLRSLIGGVDPDEGTILVQGREVQADPDAVRERLGYMPQLYGLYDDLTVEENLRFFAELQGVERQRILSRIDELLEFVRLSRFRTWRTGALSGGMYKKLAIACSIVHSPEILILDEPTNGVDPVSRRELWTLLFHLAEEGVSVLVSTPYMDEAERCHRVGLIFLGRIRREGTPAELIHSLEGRVHAVRGGNLREFMRRLERENRVGTRFLSTLYRSGDSLRVVAAEGMGDFVPDFVAGVAKGEDAIGAPERGIRIEAIRPSVEDLFMELQAEQKE